MYVIITVLEAETLTKSISRVHESAVCFDERGMQIMGHIYILSSQWKVHYHKKVKHITNALKDILLQIDQFK